MSWRVAAALLSWHVPLSFVCPVHEQSSVASGGCTAHQEYAEGLFLPSPLYSATQACLTALCCLHKRWVHCVLIYMPITVQNKNRLIKSYLACDMAIAFLNVQSSI